MDKWKCIDCDPNHPCFLDLNNEGELEPIFCPVIENEECNWIKEEDDD